MTMEDEVFPDPRQASPEGVVAIGGSIKLETLLESYSKAIFPWPQEGYPLLWFSPDPRGVLDFADLHVPTSFRKWLRSKAPAYSVKINHEPQEIIKQCRLRKRPGQAGTWILPEMEKVYAQLIKSGHGISVSIYREQQLVGGIYGVLADAPSGRYFSAESMFYKESNCSKLAFYKLIEELQNKGLKWMDVQMLTDVTESFGGVYISKEEFLERLGL